MSDRTGTLADLARIFTGPDSRVVSRTGSALATGGGDTWGLRLDGTKKGNGFLGAITRPDGGVSTELSMGTEDVVPGQETEIPLMVPTLTREELDYLLSAPPGDWQNPTLKGIARKAIDYARERQAQGLPYFAQAGEQQHHIYPDMARQDVPTQRFADSVIRPMPSHGSLASLGRMR